MTRLDNPIFFLATANAERSRAFYERVLALAFVADEPPALVFKVGDSMLRLQKVDRVHTASYMVLGWAVSDIRLIVCHLNVLIVVFVCYYGLNQVDVEIWTEMLSELV